MFFYLNLYMVYPTDCNFMKNRLQHRCFPVNIAKFLRTAFFTEHLRWLFLYFRHYSSRKLSQNKDHPWSEETERNIATISFLITIWDVQLKEITIHEDHNIQMRKPLLLLTYRNQVFLYFNLKLKSKKEKKEERKIPHTFL